MENAVLTPQEWAQCAAFLTAGTGRPIPKEMVGAFYDLLNDIPFDALKAACKRAIQQQEDNWLPSVGKIRKYASDAMHGVLPLATEAWQQVMKAYQGTWHDMETKRAWDSLPIFSQHVLRAIGGYNILQSVSGRGGTEERFLKTYDSMAKRETEFRNISPELRPKLSGDIPTMPRLTSRPDASTPYINIQQNQQRRASLEQNNEPNKSETRSPVDPRAAGVVSGDIEF